MKVLYISGREPTYTRNSVFIKALKMKGIELIECTSSARNYPLRYLSSVYQFVKERDFDLVFVGFFGQPLVPIIKCMTKKPVILDAFISGYDTMCFDRKRFSPDSCIGRSLFWLDKLSCELADYIICDTNAHVDYFCKQFSLDKSKFVSIFVGAEDDVFFPRKNKNGNGNGDFNVLYYGSYLPLHGTEYVIRAAKKLEAFKEIKFTIIGTGMMKEAIREEAKRLRAGNITFVDWVPYDVLPEEIAKADLCLGGHFSNSEKARRVIAGKTFQMIAAGKPVIVGDNSANRELFTHRGNAFFTRLADENALADAIVELKENDCLREEISRNAYRDFQNECNLDMIGESLRCLLEHSAFLQ